MFPLFRVLEFLGKNSENMEKINWDIMSNADIKLKQLTLKENYESIKNKIMNCLDELDNLDKEYMSSEKILEKRLGKK